MKFLLDSHTGLWAIADRNRLTVRVREILENDSSELFISYVSLWELSIKVATGRLVLPGNSISAFLVQLELTRIDLLPITPSHIVASEGLPWLHKDPFDRMLVAQAIEEDLTILSSDSQIALYPARTVWQ